MDRVSGKVALVTGAARGQGRAHAIRLAEEGADILALDVCRDIDSIDYPLASADDLEETIERVKSIGRRAVSAQVDVRDFRGMREAVDHAIDQLGRLDIVVANAGIVSYGPWQEISEDAWRDVFDVNVTGVWNTARAAVPHIVAGNRGGSIVITSSTAGLKGYSYTAHYSMSKHAVVGLMRSLAGELAPEMIRVNCVHPSTVDTEMIRNDATYRLFAPELENPSWDDVVDRSKAHHSLPVAVLEPVDISNAVLFLASDQSRYITGVSLPVDAGRLLQ